MAIEAEFEIQIPDTDTPGLAVLGDMHDYVVRTLRSRGETPDEERVWETLSSIVIELLGVSPDEVTRSAHIVHDLGAD